MLGFAFAAITTAAIILASRTPAWPSAPNRACRHRAYRRGSRRSNAADARAAADDARYWDAGGSKRGAGTDAG